MCFKMFTRGKDKVLLIRSPCLKYSISNRQVRCQRNQIQPYAEHISCVQSSKLNVLKQFGDEGRRLALGKGVQNVLIPPSRIQTIIDKEQFSRTRVIQCLHSQRETMKNKMGPVFNSLFIRDKNCPGILTTQINKIKVRITKSKTVSCIPTFSSC